MNEERLKIVAFLPDISGVRFFVQMISDPKKYVYLGPSNWDFDGFVDEDFVIRAILEHQFLPVNENSMFKYEDRKEFLSNFNNSHKT